MRRRAQITAAREKAACKAAQLLFWKSRDANYLFFLMCTGIAAAIQFRVRAFRDTKKTYAVPLTYLQIITDIFSDGYERNLHKFMIEL